MLRISEFDGDNTVMERGKILRPFNMDDSLQGGLKVSVRRMCEVFAIFDRITIVLDR